MPNRSLSNPPPRPRIVIAATEHAQLMHLAEHAAQAGSLVGEYLVEELSRAHIVPDDDCSPHVVRMGSHITYSEDATHRKRKVTLVYPGGADIDLNRVSILTPVGAALIGLSPAQSIRWPHPDGGMSSLTVLHVRNEQRGDRTPCA